MKKFLQYHNNVTYTISLKSLFIAIKDIDFEADSIGALSL